MGAPGTRHHHGVAEPTGGHGTVPRRSTTDPRLPHRSRRAGRGRPAPKGALRYLARRPLHDGARRHYRPSFLYERLVRPGQHPHQGRPAVRHADTYLLHFCHRLWLRVFRLRGGPVGAPGSAYRRYPPRPVDPIEVVPGADPVSPLYQTRQDSFLPSSSGSCWRRQCSTWSLGR